MKEDLRRLPEIVEHLSVGIPGMSAKLVARTDHKAIYYRWDNVWEVFRIKIVKGGQIVSRYYPRREVYPSNEDFGVIAWCFKDEKMAWKRYNSIPANLKRIEYGNNVEEDITDE